MSLLDNCVDSGVYDLSPPLTSSSTSFPVPSSFVCSTLSSSSPSQLGLPCPIRSRTYPTGSKACPSSRFGQSKLSTAIFSNRDVVSEVLTDDVSDVLSDDKDVWMVDAAESGNTNVISNVPMGNTELLLVVDALKKCWHVTGSMQPRGLPTLDRFELPSKTKLPSMIRSLPPTVIDNPPLRNSRFGFEQHEHQKLHHQYKTRKLHNRVHIGPSNKNH